MKCPNCNKEVSPEWEICPFCKYEPVKCPNCDSGWLPQDAKFCPSCGSALDTNGVIDEDCPRCESGNIVDDGSGYLQFTCKDCGYIWGNRDDIECPECGSYDIWDGGNIYEKPLTCNHCGHEWAEDDKEEVIDGKKNIEPSICIHNIWTDIVYKSGDKGMQIHLDVDMNGIRKEAIDVSAYFYYATDNPIKDTNGKFRDSNGNVATSTNVYPPYSRYNYSDLILFIPLKELHVNRECACYFIIQVWYHGKPLYTSRQVDFYATPQ